MILLSSPLKNDPLGNHGRAYFFFLEIEIVTTKIVNLGSLKKICRQLLSTMDVLKTSLQETSFVIFTGSSSSEQIIKYIKGIFNPNAVWHSYFLIARQSFYGRRAKSLKSNFFASSGNAV